MGREVKRLANLRHSLFSTTNAQVLPVIKRAQEYPVLDLKMAGLSITTLWSSGISANKPNMNGLDW